MDQYLPGYHCSLCDHEFWHFFDATTHQLGHPDEFIDAARIDGASEWSIFRLIIVPMSTSAMGALGRLLSYKLGELLSGLY